MEQVVVFVGGGATTVSWCHHLIEAAKAAEPNAGALVIYVIEQRGRFGRGLAYDRDTSGNLMNTRAGTLSPFADSPGHFYRWLMDNKKLWQDQFPELVVDKTTFVPRPLFGLYLERMMSELGHECARLGGELLTIKAEVTDIDRTLGGKFVVKTDMSLAVQADHVVLACGNLPAKADGSLASVPSYFSSPYPIRSVAGRIDKHASVGVLGARLSAIDTVLGLAASGHEGPMTLFSRSGYLPAVRGIQAPHKLQFLTREAIDAKVRAHGRLTLQDLLGFFRREMELAGAPVALPEQLTLPTPSDPIAFFESEIEAARSPRPWQAVLYATNTLIDYVWRRLGESDRTIVMRDFFSAWMSYRVSIPADNAEKILSLLKSGRLNVVTGGNRVEPLADGGFQIVVTRDGGDVIHRLDTVIAATGTPRDVRNLASPLLTRLLAKGLARPHRFGGIEVDPDSGGVIGAHGALVPRLLAAGELTSGTHFFTSVLEVNARLASLQAQAIIAGMPATPHPVPMPSVREIFSSHSS